MLPVGTGVCHFYLADKTDIDLGPETKRFQFPSNCLSFFGLRGLGIVASSYRAWVT